jgi:hypothetical protein
MKFNAVRLTLGGVSNAAWSSRILLFDPLTRNVPGTSVAVEGVNPGLS